MDFYNKLHATSRDYVPGHYNPASYEDIVSKIKETKEEQDDYIKLVKDEMVTTQMNLNDLITGMYIISINGSTNKLLINKWKKY